MHIHIGSHCWSPSWLHVFVLAAADHTLRFYSFSNNARSLPRVFDREPVDELAVAITPAPNLFEVYAPGDNRVRYRRWDGQTWKLGSIGSGSMRIPYRYSVSMNPVKAITLDIHHSSDYIILHVVIFII